MQGTRQLLEFLRDKHLVSGFFRGVLHVAIGRTVLNTTTGQLLSNGITWRELATLLKETKFERDWAKDIGVDVEDLWPKDREKFWYSVIGAAKVDSVIARTEAEQLAVILLQHGYRIAPLKGTAAVKSPPPPPLRPPHGGKEDETDEHIALPPPPPPTKPKKKR